MVAITAWSEFLCAVTPRAGQFWKTIEEECDQRNIGYLVVSYAQLMGLERGGRREARLELLMRRRAVLGFVVLRFGLTREQIAGCLRKLDTTGLPVAMFEEQGDVALRDLAGLALQSRVCRLFHCAVSTSPGRALALHLRALGHRRIACFHIVDSEPWCLSRLEGMREVYGDGSGSEAVEGVSVPGYTGFDDMRRAAEQWSPWTLPSGEKITMQTLLSPIDSAAWQSYNANYVRPLFMAEFIARHLEQAFDRLLDTQSVTAWAVVSDAVANAVLDCLKRRRVPVPGRVALATFDNTAASLARGLTSVEMNAPAIARLIIAHVTGDRRLLPPGREPVEAPCAVMVRSTTRG
jgi:DNA-binding LacI/PurR family transcriptional regulator